MAASVRVESGGVVLKPWGLQDKSSCSSVLSLYLLARNSIAAFPENLIDQPVGCKVGKSMTGPFQECPLSLPLEAVERFRDYFDYIVQPQKKATVTVTTVSLLERMREAQSRIAWPELFPETNQKMKLRNDIISSAEARQLKSTLDGVLYTCGVSTQELDCDAPVLTKVYVRSNLTCSDHVEVPYYSSETFLNVCVHCGCEGNIVTGAVAKDIYPTCSDCLDQPKVFKRKRPVFQPAAEKRAKKTV